MKIAIITSRYPSTKLPYNHMFVHARCVEMQDQGISVEVYVPSKTPKQYYFEKVSVQRLPADAIISKIKGVDAVYLHLLNLTPFIAVDGWPIYRHILKNNIPFALYVHGSEVQKYTSRFYEFNYRPTDLLKWLKKDFWAIPKMRKFVKQTLNRDNAKYIFPSLWMKEEAERNLGIKLKDSEIIPNGIDTGFFEFHNQFANSKKIVTIRSLSSKVYDIEKTIRILTYLPKEYTLDIYGTGIYLKQYQKSIDKKGLGNRVKIIPRFVDKTAMKALFRNYGIFVSTTKMDSQGITMLEAMASGLLVASTDNSSKREFITDPETGILGNEPKDIAQKIIAITKDEARFAQVTMAGRDSLSNIEKKKMAMKEIAMLKYLSKQ